jgi:photosystem II stability/assembly factor-like uncharacterized protein
MKEKDVSATIESHVDFSNNGKNKEKRSFMNRKRNLEWRQNWFYFNRFREDDQFNKVIIDALKEKQVMIRKQIKTADHLAGYAPAGAGTPWFSIGPRNINGRIKSLAVHPSDPNTVYAGAASGGVWKSTNAGQSWKSLWNMQDTMAIGSIVIASSSPNTLYVGTGEWTPGYGPSFPGTGLFVSNDGGNNWTQRTTLSSRRVARVLVSQDNASIVYVAGENGFEKSIDAGVTWTTVRTGQISDAVIDPNDSDTLYINVRHDGIYKTEDAGVSWTLLTNGPTSTQASWIKLAIGDNGASGSNFLLAKRAGTIYKSTDGGSTFSTLSGSHGDSPFSEWCNLLAVAPDDENIIIAGGVGLERTSNGGSSWNPLSGLHADHHQAVFAPSDTNIIYSCNDGGMYRSSDKGASFKKVSDGLIVTQFYDVGAWSALGTVVGGGTQDNGTNMTTGGLTWRHILGADGGYFVIHPTDPRIIYAESQYTTLRKSIDGGNSWVAIQSGLSGSTPWVGVISMDVNAPDTLFVGTNAMFKTTDGCATPWVKVSQDLLGDVSTIAIAESDGNRVYCGTTGGRIYRTDDGGTTTTWTQITGSLPTRVVNDIVVSHTNRDRVAVCYSGVSGTGTSNHVFLSTNGGTTWTDISSNLPNISVNALAFDPNNTDTLYAGTDVGVFRTIDGGVTWTAFDNGIPNVIISDLVIDRIANTLTAATFGRGMFRVSTLAVAEPVVDLYLRDSLLDTGERFPSPSGQPNPNDPTDDVYWWESPDIKVDATPYFIQDALFDGVEFDELPHEDPRRSETNRFYLQVHNRGWQNATNVSVRAFLADASAGLPPLPNALVAPDFNLTSTANWKPVGPSQIIPVLEPNQPVIISWDYLVPAAAASHSCLLAVISSNEDPITTTETNVDLLINSEKRVCLKNLHVIDNPGPSPMQQITTLNFHNARTFDDVMDIIINPKEFSDGTIGLMIEPLDFVDENRALQGVTRYKLEDGEKFGTFYLKPGTKGTFADDLVLEQLDRSQLFEFDPSKTSSINGIRIAAGQKIRAVITSKGSKKVGYGQTQQFTVLQRQGGKIVGGSTYEVRLKRAAAMVPVSKIKIILEKVKILKDHEPWFKGRSDVKFICNTMFNGEPCRTSQRMLPERGVFKISDLSGKNEKIINECIFEGYASESDWLALSISPLERDTFDPDDKFTVYERRFTGPPETWIGSYRPDDETKDAEALSDWMVWYRIESKRI